MSYLVLARKWRPQTFEEVIGQDHIIKTLSRAIKQNRIGHAYLFSGPRGIGKTTTARIFAKALNCLNFDAPTETPCNKCTSCIEISESRSPDVLEIDGASNRSVEDARELRKHIYYTPVGRFKVVIIDEVHMLTTEAFNTLLKTLEEPPENVIFIFATTEPHKVLPTIKSRCQHLDFKRVSTKEISKYLVYISQSEGFKLSEDAAEIVAMRADGAVRDSLTMLDQLMAFSPEGVINSENAGYLLGVMPIKSFERIAGAICTKNPGSMLDELNTILESGFDPIQIAKGLIENFRNALLAKSSALPESFPNKDIFKSVAKSRTTHDLLRILKLLTATKSRMSQGDIPRYILEETLVYLSLMDDVKSIAELLDSTKTHIIAHEIPTQSESGIFAKTSTRDTIHKPSKIDDKTKAKPLKTKGVQSISDDFIKQIALTSETTASLLEKTVISLADKTLKIKFPKHMEDIREKWLMNKEKIGLLRQIGHEVVGFEVDIELEILDDSEIEQEKMEDSEKNTNSKERQDIPLKVAKILDLFNAKLEN